MTGRIVVVGSLNVDLVVTADRLPDTGETLIGSGFDQHAGGKGLNQAVAAARMGAVVEMVGATGDDGGGRLLLGVLGEENIGATAVLSTPTQSGTALIEVDARGANRIVVVPGANATVDEHHATSFVEGLGDVAVVLAQSEIPFEAVRAAFAAARRRGAVTILNPAPASPHALTLLPLVDYLVPNEFEAALLSGLPTTTSGEAIAAARDLVARGPRCVIVTRGAEGAIWATADASGSVAAYEVEAIDSVAAGDAFCGAFAAMIAEGADMETALRFASAAGALATTAMGAVPSLPRRAFVEKLLAAD